MKVAITHPYSWPEVRRGAERIVVETAAALAQRGHDVTVITAGSQAATATVDGYRLRKLRRRHENNHEHEEWFAKALVPRLVAGRYDVVHSLFPADALAAVRTRALGGHRVVYEELGIPYAWWWEWQPDTEIRRRLVEAVDDYACMSLTALRALGRDHGRAGVLIPGGVRLDDFAISPQRADRPTVLFSGTLTDRGKGVHFLLDAVAIAAEKEPDIELWLSGPGDPSPWLEAAPAAARQRTVHLPLGEPNEQGDRYGRAWVTSLPSRGDSFGMVLLESLACGTPIVVTSDGAPPELVTDGTGVVVSPDDPEALAVGLLEAIELAADPATAPRCRATAAPFAWETGIAPQLEVIYAGRGRDPLAAEVAARDAVAASILADPPGQRRREIDADCARFIARVCQRGSRTLETSCGLSTVLLAELGAAHTCVAASQEDADAIREHCGARGIDLATVTIAVGSSDDLLPSLDPGPLDFCLIDGAGGFPLPITDWFYGARHLRLGGILVVDAIDLAAAHGLLAFLDADHRWVELRRTSRWAAFERRREGTLHEEPADQDFYRVPKGMSRAEERLRTVLGPVKQRVLDAARR